MLIKWLVSNGLSNWIITKLLNFSWVTLSSEKFYQILQLLAKMVMKTESPSPKTNLSISSWCLLSSGVTQLLFLKPMNSFCPERHSITPTSSSSIPVVLVWFGFSVVLSLWFGLELGRFWLFLGAKLVVGYLISLGNMHRCFHYIKNLWLAAIFLQLLQRTGAGAGGGKSGRRQCYLCQNRK